MTLNSEQQQQVLSILNSRNLGSNGCQMCGTQNSWQLEPVIYETREFTGTDGATGDAVFPAIVLTCGACGNAVFLSALRLGILVPVEETEMAAKEDSGQEG